MFNSGNGATIGLPITNPSTRHLRSSARRAELIRFFTCSIQRQRLRRRTLHLKILSLFQPWCCHQGDPFRFRFVKSTVGVLKGSFDSLLWDSTDLGSFAKGIVIAHAASRRVFGDADTFINYIFTVIVNNVNFLSLNPVKGSTSCAFSIVREKVSLASRSSSGTEGSHRGGIALSV